MRLFNPNVSNLIEPPIPLALSWSKNYDEGLGPLIDLSLAVPSYSPHKDLMDNFIKSASDEKLLAYGEIEGERILRENYSQHLNDKYSSQIKWDQTLITSGCNQAFIASILSIAGSGDEILIPNPGYFSHELTLKMLGIKSSYFNLDPLKNFNFSIKDIEKIINSKTKAICLVSPNNPTGTIFNSNLLNELLSLCQKHGLFFILDETYRDFIYPKPDAPHFLFNITDWGSTLIQLYSFSKSFCIPGHRLGAITADTNILKQISKVMDNIQICAPRAAQIAVAKFLPDLESFLAKKSLEIGEKGKLFEQTLKNNSNWEVKSRGAFFAYVKHPFKNCIDIKVAEILASSFGIITVPGSFFGKDQESFLRMSFAGISKSEILQIPDRLKKLEREKSFDL